MLSSLLFRLQIPHATPHPHSKTLKHCRTLSSAPMKDPRPSHGSVYVPPHHRLRSVVTNCSTEVSTAQLAVARKGETEEPAVAGTQNQQPLKRNWECDGAADARCEDSFDCGNDAAGFNFGAVEGSVMDRADQWKLKMAALLRDKDKQEVVSREKRDRLEYENIAALATAVGLFSHLYNKVAVVSKVPLPNYRYDLDDKRTQREVVIPYPLYKDVSGHLASYISQKSSNTSSSGNSVCSWSTNGINLSNDETLFELQESSVQNKAAVEKIRWRISLQLRNQQQAWQESVEGKRMLEFRHTLPVYKERDAILSAISQNQIIFVSGETGCGKTTQIPQFILESEIDSVRGATCSIICTQPRRISAISVSERVATERGEQLGESVGYKVRLEGVKGRDTHLLFCTTGVLLRRLLVDRNLRGISHIIVDEIHERGMNEDFLLIILRDLLPHRPELKLILMSATLDAELFSSYFGGAPLIRIPGFTYPVQTYFLENILEMTGYRLTPSNQVDDYGSEKIWKMNKNAPGKRKSQISSVVDDVLSAADFNEYSHQTQESLRCWNPDYIGFSLIEHLLCQICEREKPGAILVFMTGWDDISSLRERLQAHPILGDTTRVLLLACHSSMASSEQKLIFEKPDNGVRKIILATNIAETSITIDDVVYVIDCGKAKETSYDALNNTPCLLPSWISKVSVRQRRGRAGRVQPGECFHMYPRCVYNAFVDFQLPEILRTPLQSLCLQIKSLQLGNISEFLAKALQSPELLAVQNAIEHLKIIGALDKFENLTALGRYLIKLPLEPKLGKMLIIGAIFHCLDPILTIVAGLSVRDPFLSPMDKKDLADAAKAQFSVDQSDHLAIFRAYEGWKIAEMDQAGYDYCWKNFISVQSMKAIDSLRREFLSLLKDIGLVDSDLTSNNVWSYDMDLVRAIICYGLYPGICSVVPNDKSFTLKTMEDGKVLLNSNSVNSKESTMAYPWLIFNEKIKVNSIFVRDSTAISDSALLLFGGNITRGDSDGHLQMLGGYLEFFMEPSVAGMFLTVRRELDEVIQSKLLNPTLEMHTHHKLISAVRLLLSNDKCDGRFVFKRQVQNQKPSSVPINPPDPSIANLNTRRVESGPGGDNSKSQLQTLLTRAGYPPPNYKSKQLNTGQFLAMVEFNGTQVVGHPRNNKKQAEKDAASEALAWLMDGSPTGNEVVNQMSMILKKKSKKSHH
uniref:RNA helicase n=1 Tax=Kalanchoe fedtschenkoi TaxID=63787 RepID=A0A7N0VCD2_KALFE